MKQTLLFLVLLSSAYAFSQVSLVSDFLPGADSTNPELFYEFNNDLYFTTTTQGVFGQELSRYNGSNIAVMKNINPGDADAEINQIIGFNGNLFFTANDGTHGKEVWSGLNTNLNLFLDIRTGSDNSTPLNYTVFNGKLYFSAFTNNEGRELWVSDDGTSTNTYLLKDIVGGNGNSSNPSEFTEFNGELYFIVRFGFETQIWKTDGTNTGTVLAVNGSAVSLSQIENLFVFNNKLYFVGTNSATGMELWESDGTASNTQLVLDLNPGIPSSNPQNFTLYNNRLYFTASNPGLGNELFYVGTNGNITNAANINPASGDAFPNNLTVYNGKLYFSATNGTDGVELWETTGTSFSTIMLKDINPTSESTPMGFVEYNGNLYFNADDGITGRELWVTDGTSAGTFLVDDINNMGDSDPLNLIVFDNELFFSADNGASGRELFKFNDAGLSNQDFILDETLTLYPNPVKDYLIIKSKYALDLIEIFNTEGKLVKKFKNVAFNYDVSDLMQGLYFLRITSRNGIVIRKLIKD